MRSTVPTAKQLLEFHASNSPCLCCDASNHPLNTPPDVAKRSASTATKDKLYCWGLVTVPTKLEIIEVSRFCGPLFLIRLGVSYYWSSLAYAAAAAGTVSLASHQVLIGMFWLFTMVGISPAQRSRFQAWMCRRGGEGGARLMLSSPCATWRMVRIGTGR